ncbi:CBS domain-containing protein [Burkholderia sp. Ac-20349]|uniref:CBS domain-containing protein n=1 Tax=Burkholderia sp. Ac-20349 TaxID=2703893 RepID=UPI00197BFDE9|nr:CBS domain-containing protein [Burkholderia sp. Ac-20349]MBN3840975.1 CBS domain-containing protein [Burkholderia sp. Ac-20349]
MEAEARNRLLNDIAQSLQDGRPVEPISVRELIGWFDALRRGANVNRSVRRALEQAGLETVPDFEGSHIDGRVQLMLANALQQEPQAGEEPGQQAGDQPMAQEVEAVVEFVGGAGVEPAYRVSRLLDPRLPLVTIGPDATLEQAATLMLRHDYSQLPVMTNERDVRGVVSWESIGPAMTLGHPPPRFVRECMRQHVEVKATDSIFQVINRIIESSYVLVRDERRVVVGILTTTDLSQQFQDLAEPFLLIGEIENHIRALIDGRFTQLELEAVRNENDPERSVESVADLTLGEHIRLIQNPDNWVRLGLRVDRGVFVKELDEIRQLRNDVMHFDSDRITDVERDSLRNFVQFLHQLKVHQPVAAVGAGVAVAA